MKKARVGMLLVALVSTQFIADGVADEALQHWPQWRGPTWNGVALQADPPVTWSETENLQWKTRLEGKGHGTPIVWGDRIFLQTALALDKELAIPNVIPTDTPNIKVSPGNPSLRGNHRDLPSYATTGPLVNSFGARLFARRCRTKGITTKVDSPRSRQ